MTVKEIKSALLKKGWAGKTISRKETAERLNPLIEAHVKLKLSYANFLPLLASDTEQQELERILKTLRLDVGKLKELVFSCGEPAFNGTSLEPGSFKLASDNALSELREREQIFRERLERERPVQHQIRSEAVIVRLRKNSDNRLAFLRTCAHRALTAA